MSEYRLAEKPAMQVLAALGYQPLAPEAALAMRVEENRVILKPVLIAALQALNGIGAGDAEAVYNDLATLSDNEEWQRKLRGGYSRRLSGENRDRPIALIDFKTPSNNTFHVVSQLRVAAQRPRIPDIVLFVNGKDVAKSSGQKDAWRPRRSGSMGARRGASSSTPTRRPCRAPPCARPSL